MKIPRLLSNRWLWAIALPLALLLLPYVFSRVASPWRCVRVYTAPDAAESKSPGSPTTLRILTYNIAHGRGMAKSNWEGGDRAERMARLDEIAELLRRVDADVVVLNEVDFDSSWSYSVDQARYLAEKVGYPYWVEQRNLDFRAVVWKWRFGNAVLSRYPIASAQIADFPGYSTWQTALAGKHSGVVCDIQAGDSVVRVVAAHLSYRSERLRVQSAAMLVHMARESTLPTIVAGDLNSTPPGFPKSFTDPDGNNAIATLDQSELFQRSPTDGPPTESELTFQGSEPYCVIDWILIPPDWQFVEYRVEQSDLSDHRPRDDDGAGRVDHRRDPPRRRHHRAARAGLRAGRRPALRLLHRGVRGPGPRLLLPGGVTPRPARFVA